MGVRVNVLISDEAFDVLKNYQSKNKISNRDSAVEHILMEYGRKNKTGST